MTRTTTVPVPSPEGITGAAAQLGYTSDLAATLHGIAAAALTSLGADRATCYAYDVESQVVSGVYTTEEDPAKRAYLERTVGRGAVQLPIWRLQLEREDPLLLIADVTRCPDISPALTKRLGSGAILGVRLEHASVRKDDAPALLGTLFCSYGEPRTFSTFECQAARGFAGLAALTLANARLQLETAMQLEEKRVLAAEQAALRRVATRVATERNPDKVFAQAAREVAVLLGVPCGLIARFEDDHAVPVGFWGIDQDYLNVPVPLSGDGALAQVARTGRVARIADYHSIEHDSVTPIARRLGYRSGVAAPVHVDGKLWGALLAATTRERAMDVTAGERLERFASLIALAIANAEAQAQLASRAATDPLTGLANHGAFFERLNAEIHRARRGGHPLSLVLIDLDHFKRVNDVHGHLIGDSALVETAERLVELARAEDTVARIGGEEFAWLLPECDAPTALLAAERARLAIGEIPYAEVGRMTLSAGIAELGGEMTSNDLFRAADTALYQGKADGRDVCISYSDAAARDSDTSASTSRSRPGPGIERFMALAREQLGMAVVAVAQTDGERLIWRHLDGDGELFGIAPGTRTMVDEGYCETVVRERVPSLIRDARREFTSRDSVTVAKPAQIGAYIGVPVVLPDGRFYGSLCCLSQRPEPQLGIRDIRLLKVLAEMIGEDLGRQEQTTQVYRRQRERILRVLEHTDGMNIVFQPIVDLNDGTVVAAEALTRFMDEPRRPPQVWFAEAEAVQMGITLELAAVRSALAHLGDLPALARLSFNLSPGAVCAPELVAALAGLPGERLAIELTEHAVVDNLAVLEEVLANMRTRGVQIMIDDAGAGFSGLKRILSLRPDVIKLDLSLTRDIDSDPVRRALAASLVTFGRDTDVTIVAEGIETHAELETLRELGVTHGQGYFLGRPLPGLVPSRVPLTGAPALIAS